MCDACVGDAGGFEVQITDEHKRIAGLIWDWYHAPDGVITEWGDIEPFNGCGGALHVQLDDYNLEDCFLRSNWNTYKDHKTGEVKQMFNYSLKTLELGNEIIQSLLLLSEAERNITVHISHPYGSERPF